MSRLRLTSRVLLRPSSASQPRRRNYELTAFGRVVLRAESERLAKLLEVACDKKVLTVPAARASG